MKIFTAEQIKQADQATMRNQSLSSLELMERASEAMAQQICGIVQPEDSLLFFVGKGGNGGDGLAIARILANAGFNCTVAAAFPAGEMNEDCRFNFERLPDSVPVVDALKVDTGGYDAVVDALLGSGTEGSVREPLAGIISRINGSGRRVIAVDIPSGMHTEPPDEQAIIVCADVTLTVQFPKLSMLLPQAGGCCGEIKVVDIGLDEEYMDNTPTPYHYVTEEDIMPLLKPRGKFTNKGTFGHALLICGSSEMMGAAILAAGGALRSGCGLVTVHVPEKQSVALFASAPSAILSADKGKCFTTLPSELDKYTVCGIGPGLGRKEETLKAFARLMLAFDKPMVLDADALNMISTNPQLWEMVPGGSVLTPHPGEFERLAGRWESETEKLDKVRQLSASHNIIVVLKGANTAVCMPDGSIFFNSTGCAAMAKGGSGDVLTGFITGLVARGYTGREAALLGVYLHGLGGEKAAGFYGSEAMNSSDLPDFIAEAYRELEEIAGQER